LRRLVGGIDAGEIAEFTTACFGVEAGGVMLFTPFEWGAGEDFEEAVLADDVGGLEADISVRRSEGADGNDAGIIDEAGDFGGAAEVFGAAGGGEIEFFADTEAHVFAIEDDADGAEIEEALFEGIGDVGFA